MIVYPIRNRSEQRRASSPSTGWRRVNSSGNVCSLDGGTDGGAYGIAGGRVDRSTPSLHASKILDDNDCKNDDSNNNEITNNDDDDGSAGMIDDDVNNGSSGDDSSSGSDAVLFPLKIRYCPLNPCITAKIHEIHKLVLDGIDGAEEDLSRYISLCAFLRACTQGTLHGDDDGEDDDNNNKRSSSSSSIGSGSGTSSSSPSSGPAIGKSNFPPRAESTELTARIVLECTCGLREHDIRICKSGYVQQFRSGSRARFLHHSPLPGGGCAQKPHNLRQHQRQHHDGALRIPIVALLPTMHASFHEDFLPDLGLNMRCVLQQRLFSDSAKKCWVKAAGNMQVLSSSSSSSSFKPPQCTPDSNQQASSHGGDGLFRAPSDEEGVPRTLTSAMEHASCVAAHAVGTSVATAAATSASFHARGSSAAAASRLADEAWGRQSTLCSALMQESIPCMKRSKKAHCSGASSATGLKASASQDGQQKKPVSKIDASACINVLYGTLLKLYTLGAKVPTFNARVELVFRLREVAALSPLGQAEFLERYSSLARVCFMEYTINALSTWMPCERDLFMRTSPAMQAYTGIAVATCDLFRQDSIITGTESWACMDSAAAASIERCIRVCKFKIPRSIEPVFKPAKAFGPGAFDHRALDMPHLPCTVPALPQSQQPKAQQKQQSSRQNPVPAASEHARPPDGGFGEGCRSNELGASSECRKLCPCPVNGIHPASPGLSDLLCSLIGDASRTAEGPESLSLLLRSASFLHQNFSVHLLPDVVWQRQQESLSCMHGMCTARARAASRMSFCVVCAIAGKGFQGKLRMCTATGTLMCTTCAPGTVVTISMTGVLIRLNGTSFFMCPCCTGIRVWVGDGSDFQKNECCCWKFGGTRSMIIARYNSAFSAACGLQYTSTYLCEGTGDIVSGAPSSSYYASSSVAGAGGPLGDGGDSGGGNAKAALALHRGSAWSSSSWTSPSSSSHQRQSPLVSCMVCASRNTYARARLILVDPPNRVMRRVNFCRRHAPPDHLMCTVTSYEELCNVVALHCAQKASQQRGGGGGGNCCSSRHG